MSKVLIVAEKPSVAKDIAAALGGFHRVENWLESDTAIVSCAVGHLIELFVPEAATTGTSLATLPVIPRQFSLRVIERTKDQFRLLTGLMNRPDIEIVINACDAGREGELIFRLIYKKAACKKPMRRMWLQSMTPDAIRKGYKTCRPGEEFDQLSDAAMCRSEADWIIGINGSRGVTDLRERQTQKNEILSAGRVQTPTLAILVHQELKIVNFVPQDYWEVHATFAVKAGEYEGKWFNPQAKDDGGTGLANRFTDRQSALAIVNKCRGISPSSVADTSKPLVKKPPLLFDLTSLQREANVRYKFSAKKTLDIAQSLYEKHKATTYPRTDSCCLPEDYMPTVVQTLKSFTGTTYGEHADQVLSNGWTNAGKRIYDNSKISDHFAIVPTGQQPTGMSPAEATIYDMVVRRFIAAFFPQAEYLQTTRISIVSQEHFKSAGKVLTARGWLTVYGNDLDEDAKTPSLCVYNLGEPVTNNGVMLKSLKTRAPSRFTEASLLGAMENAGKLVDDDELREAMKDHGLGTPATRATIIEGLLSTKNGSDEPKEPYVTREDNDLVPTAKGIDLIAFLETNGIEALVSPKMTGEWEQKLRQMEKGGYERTRFMSEINDLTRNIIDIIRKKAPKEKYLQSCCPSCGAGLTSGFRTIDCEKRCGFTIWRRICGRTFSDAEIEHLLQHGQTPILDGFYSDAKKKKFSGGLKLNDEFKTEFFFESQASTPNGVIVACPTCGKPMRRIKGERRFFWGCTGYREGCRTTMKDVDGTAVPNPTSSVKFEARGFL